MLLSALVAVAKQTMPLPHRNSQLVQVGAYPTQVVATVKSLEPVKNSHPSDIGEDIVVQKTLYLIKLRIHTTRALTGQGTTINNNESLQVISREPLDKTLVGKQIKALVEMRGDTTRQCWLLTEILPKK
jgi:hypothetical protein